MTPPNELKREAEYFVMKREPCSPSNCKGGYGVDHDSHLINVPLEEALAAIGWTKPDINMGEGHGR